MNGKKAKWLRRWVRRVGVGQPETGYDRSEFDALKKVEVETGSGTKTVWRYGGGIRLAQGCSRYQYQLLKKGYKKGQKSEQVLR